MTIDDDNGDVVDDDDKSDIIEAIQTILNESMITMILYLPLLR
jgi:hypothetical protein